jgi:hypothetical protein
MNGLLSFSDRFHQKYVHTNICVQRIGASCIFLGLYVDDLIFVSNQKKKCGLHYIILSREFGMTNFKEVAYCLGIQIKHNKNHKKLHLS